MRSTRRWGPWFPYCRRDARVVAHPDGGRGAGGRADSGARSGRGGDAHHRCPLASTPVGTSPAASHQTVFNHAGGHWVRAPGDAAQAKGLEGLAEAPPREDVLVPLRAEDGGGRRQAAANWLALLDAGAADAALSEMTDSFRAQLTAAPAQWQHVLQRRAGLGKAGGSSTGSRAGPPTWRRLPAASPPCNTSLARRMGPGAGARDACARPTGCKVTGYTCHPLHSGEANGPSGTPPRRGPEGRRRNVGNARLVRRLGPGDEASLALLAHDDEDFDLAGRGGGGNP